MLSLGQCRWAYLGQRDDLAKATRQRDTARGDAMACRDAAEALRWLAAKCATIAMAARTHQQRADYTLGLQPSKPADLCASMQALGDEWLQGRARP